MIAGPSELDRLDRLDRGAITDVQGRSFKDFRRSLSPRFARVWFDIGGGWVALGLIAWGVIALDHRFPNALPLTVLLGALAFGYVVAYLLLFFHEAAHFNIAPTRGANDALANLFLGLLTGQDIRAYRVVHFDHHRHLGTTEDTEHSYFSALTLRFFLEAFIGIKALRVVLWRMKHVGQASAKTGAAEHPSGLWMLVAGLVVNASITFAAAWFGCWALVFAWPLGVLLVHPAINALRQLLEHRAFEAESSVDYSRVPHGATARMFGTGPLASTLGAAGFNRHILHHWEPQISYTRFAELERFLLGTSAAEVLRDAKTTYAHALLRLLRAP